VACILGCRASGARTATGVPVGIQGVSVLATSGRERAVSNFALVGERVINVQHVKMVEFAEPMNPGAGCTVYFSDGSTLELKGEAADSLRQRLFPMGSTPGLSMPQ